MEAEFGRKEFLPCQIGEKKGNMTHQSQTKNMSMPIICYYETTQNIILPFTCASPKVNIHNKKR